jgi:hypothetical protein
MGKKCGDVPNIEASNRLLQEPLLQPFFVVDFFLELFTI